jgi:hypothetical protein
MRIQAAEANAPGDAPPAVVPNRPTVRRVVPAAGVAPPPRAGRSKGEINTVYLLCRGVNLRKLQQADANRKLGYAVVDAIKARSTLFGEGTELTGNFVGDEDGTLTFTFEVMVKLKRPFRL